MTVGAFLCGWGWIVAAVIIACLVAFIHTQVVIERHRRDVESTRRKGLHQGEH
jgi:hypothetical protein